MKVRIPPRLSAKQNKAMDRLITDRIIELEEEHAKDFDATVLWALHETFGFGAERLKRFYRAYQAEYKRLREYYQLEESDGVPWLCRRKLAEIGVDVDEI